MYDIHLKITSRRYISSSVSFNEKGCSVRQHKLIKHTTLYVNKNDRDLKEINIITKYKVN